MKGAKYAGSSPMTKTKTRALLNLLMQTYSFSRRLSHCSKIFCKDRLNVLPLRCFRVTTDLSLILSSWVLLPAGLAVPVIVMLTVNVTGALGMGKHSDLMRIKTSTLTLKPEISNVWLLFSWTWDSLGSKIYVFSNFALVVIEDFPVCFPQCGKQKFSSSTKPTALCWAELKYRTIDCGF